MAGWRIHTAPTTTMLNFGADATQETGTIPAGYFLWGFKVFDIDLDGATRFNVVAESNIVGSTYSTPVGTSSAEPAGIASTVSLLEADANKMFFVNEASNVAGPILWHIPAPTRLKVTLTGSPASTLASLSIAPIYAEDFP